MLNCAAFLLDRLVNGGNKENDLKGYASMQLAGSFTTFATSVASYSSSALFSAIGSLVSFVFWALMISSVFALLYSIHEYHPEILLNAVDYWNDPVGPILQRFFIDPIMILNPIMHAILGIWNFLTWIVVQIWVNVVFVEVGLNFDNFSDILLGLSDFFTHIVMGGISYVRFLAVQCPMERGDACYAVGNRVFDFITPMADLRRVAYSTIEIGDSVCSLMNAPVKIVMYPFLDINFAKAVHNLLNGILFTLFQIPSVTVLRCHRNNNNLIMCLPDFDPCFNLLTVGLRNLGAGIDNWLDVASVIIQSHLGLGGVECDLVALGLGPSNYSKSLFAGAQPSIVGLTEGLYAVTDGVHVEYFSSYSSTESIAIPNAWPIPIDVQHGVAAVTMHNKGGTDEMGDTRTTMLGCKCFDDNDKPPVRILCGLVPNDIASYSETIDVSDAFTFEVYFQKRSTANYLTCKSIEISVQSVRWPSTRFTGSYDNRDLFENSCQIRQTCNSVDATIWVAPMCSSSTDVQLACISLFQESSCYPYCMASRVAGSGAGSLVLYSASDWHNKVHIMNRDCGVSSHLGDPLACVSAGTCAYSAIGNLLDSAIDTVTTVLNGDVLQGAVVIKKWDAEKGCVQSTGSVSIISSELHEGYVSKSFKSLLMPGQPFSFAGDTTLTGVRDGAGNHFVKVDRLYGNELNEFTMVNVQKGFPAAPLPDTIQLGSQEKFDVTKLPIPYAFSDVSGIRHPSVATPTSVYFVVNPSLGMFKGFGSWCASGGQVAKLQLSALSSYAPVRIWKVDPYGYCPVGDDGTPECKSGFEPSLYDIPDSFTELGGDELHVFDARKCSMPFSVAVTGLEYINQENIAVTILYAPFNEYLPETGLLKEDATIAHYKIKFMSTVSMALSDSPHDRDSQQRTVAQGMLCPAMRRFPNIGSLLTELLSAGLNLMRLSVGLVVSTPGLAQIWKQDTACSLVTHGHSLLQKCGSDFLSLDDFWDSLFRAQNHFWGGFGIIAERIRDMGEDTLANVVDGIAYVGVGSTNPFAAYGFITSSVKIPVEEIGSSITKIVMPNLPGVAGSLKMVSVNPVALAQYTYNLVTTTVAELIPLAIRIDRKNGDNEAARELTYVFINKVYQSRDGFADAVVGRMLTSCQGFSLMFGYSNPWGVLMRKQCEAMPILLLAILDLVLGIVSDVPVAKCLCVDARQSADFKSYAMDHCYYFVPMHMKPLVLSLIENSFVGGDEIAACDMLLDYANLKIKNSLKNFFEKQFQATDALASSVDYLLHVFNVDAGRCLDFEDPYTTVLIPEPVDYFNACSMTSLCENRCGIEIDSFNKAISDYGTQDGNKITSAVVVQSLFFNEINEDSTMPMKIVGMVELSSCVSVCGGLSFENTGSVVPKDSCIAIAGIHVNNTIIVKKYCVPKAVGYSVRSAATETWTVWYSEEWTSGAIDIQFADTLSGDSLIVLHDGRGTGDVLKEQYVSVHLRSNQADPLVWDRWYSTTIDRAQRLLVAKASSSVVGLFQTDTVLALTDIFVLPKDTSGRNPWVIINIQVDRGETNIAESQMVSVCAELDVDLYSAQEDMLSSIYLRTCDIGEFFQVNSDIGYMPVILKSGNIQTLDLVLIPTTKNSPFVKLQFSFDSFHGLYIRSDSSSRVEFQTPKDFLNNGIFPSYLQFSNAVSRLTTGIRNMEGRDVSYLGGGVTARVKPRICQNTLASITTVSDAPLQIFFSANPNVPTHWLTKVKLTVSLQDGEYGVSGLQESASDKVEVMLTATQNCDRRTCLGCVSKRLQALCYAMRSCTIVRCVGTVVNQNKPMCNIGLTMQSLVNYALSLVLGGWNTFTETYNVVLNLSLKKSEQGFTMDWVDDSFFGVICSAKDIGGQASSLITSIVGAGISLANARVDVNAQRITIIENKLVARGIITLNGVNSFLYQLSLLPLYAMMAIQKTVVCTGKSLTMVVSMSGLEVSIGRADLQLASDAATGVCLGATGDRDSDEGYSDSSVTGAAIAQVLMAKRSPGLMVIQHSMDAMITYAIGVVSGMQDMAQNIDESHCKVPDYYMYKTLHCACGDESLKISPERARETVDEYSHWCTGTLKLQDAFGNTVFINNPHSFQSLTEMMGDKVDSYLECISKLNVPNTPAQDCTLLRPFVRGIDDMQFTEVMSISVLQRCRANYQQMKWDDGAYKMYEDKFLGIGDVGTCLMDAQKNGLSNTGCMQNHINQDLKAYFSYVKSVSTRTPDACTVFTGPANHDDPYISKQFQPCISSYIPVTPDSCYDMPPLSAQQDSCKIPSMIWSTSSKNKVPVASLHSIENSVAGESRESLALRFINDGQKEALCALDGLEEYANENLEVFLFSAEGDSLHQMFDCMVQGPYAKVDFWSKGVNSELPVPDWARDAGGLGNSRTLDLPCNMEKLNGDTIPPFTCGGETRKAMIKYFVRKYINGDGSTNGGASLTERLVRQQIERLREAWGGNHIASDFLGCVGEDGVNRVENCNLELFSTNPNALLPSGLRGVEFSEIPAEDVLKSIHSKIWGYLQGAMAGENDNEEFKFYNRPDVKGSWDWLSTDLGGAASVDGLYDSQMPIINYTAGEAGYPFKDEKSIWDMCTGMVSQVMFTMPMATLQTEERLSWTTSSVLQLRTETLKFDPTMPVDFDGDRDALLSGSSMLERYVGALLKDSFSKSSTFWHYAMRHVPSKSLVCASATSTPLEGHLQFKNSANLPFTPTSSSTDSVGTQFDMHGYSAFPLGGVRTECFCGWTLVANRCIIPSNVCTNMMLSQCDYDIESHTDVIALTKQILLSWNNTGRWACPEMDLSDSWGIVPSGSVDAWIQQSVKGSVNTLDIADLLVFGYSGLRIGNMDILKDQSMSEGVNPSNRKDKLVSESGDVSQRRCEHDILQSFDADSLVTEVVDDLFPAAQGIRDSALVSSCLRFSIEYLRQRVMNTITLNGFRDLTEKISIQETTVETWRNRCEIQLEMLGVCRSSSLLEYIPETEHHFECPFDILTPYSELKYYITPGCLVYVKDSGPGSLVGAFFDPCRGGVDSFDCSGSERPRFSIGELTSSMKIPFDVRSTGSSEALGTWPVVFLSNDATVNEMHSVLAEELVKWRRGGRNGTMPWRLSTEFAKNVVDEGGVGSQGGIGNTKKGKDWGKSEGFANTSVEFCDAIADWWPEDWSKPVGYHVTLPCESEHAAYRTFDSAFVMQKDPDTFHVTMRYMHSMLRDPQKVHSEYGRAGFCRRGVYGMPTYVTNTMRVCTRDSVNVSYDATVPVKPRFNDGNTVNSYGEMYCSDSAYDVPWSIDNDGLAISHPGMFSVGHVAMYHGQAWGNAGDAALKYPGSDRQNEMDATHPGVRDYSWGGSCTDGDVLECETHDDCVALDGLDASVSLVCYRGVCVKDFAATDKCYDHTHCIGDDKVCSGEGFCEKMVWQVENDLSSGMDIEFDLFSQNCHSEQDKTETYDMLGGSQWQSIPDILEMYGMCSKRNWFEFRQFLQPENISSDVGSCQDPSCELGWFDTTRRKWVTTDGFAPIPSLYSTKKFRVLPHECDRDYMHIEGMRGCAPREPVVLSSRNGISLGISLDGSRGVYAQTINRDKYIGIIRSEGKLFDNAVSGFLSMDETVADGFTMCRDVEQCLPKLFTYDGESVSRSVYDSSTQKMKLFDSGKDFADSDVCGSFGTLLSNNHPTCQTLLVHENDHCCQIDNATVPQYALLCNPFFRDDILQECNAHAQIISLDSIKTVCDDLSFDGIYTTSRLEVSVRDNTIRNKARHLNSLWDKLSSGTSNSMMSDTYIAKTSCSDKFYEYLAIISNPLECETKAHPFCGMYKQNMIYSIEHRKDWIAATYYVGRYSTLEFPFVWWHQCMMLQSKSFSTSLSLGDDVECNAWTHVLDEDNQDYGGEASVKLYRINKGIKRSDLDQAKIEFKIKINEAITQYNPEGITDDYQAQCHSKIIYKSRDDMVSVAKSSRNRTICESEILRWVYDDGADTNYFHSGCGFTGCYGISENCYTDDPSSLTDIGNDIISPLRRAKMFMQEYVEGDKIPFDFLTNWNGNNDIDGFLVEEHIPRAPPISFYSKSNWVASHLQLNSKEYENPLCIHKEDVTKYGTTTKDFFQCTGDGHIPLQETHCEKVYLDLKSVIDKFSVSSMSTGSTYDKESGSSIQDRPTGLKKDLLDTIHAHSEAKYIECTDQIGTHICDPTKNGSPCFKTRFPSDTDSWINRAFSSGVKNVADASDSETESGFSVSSCVSKTGERFAKIGETLFRGKVYETENFKRVMYWARVTGFGQASDKQLENILEDYLKGSILATSPTETCVDKTIKTLGNPIVDKVIAYLKLDLASRNENFPTITVGSRLGGVGNKTVVPVDYWAENALWLLKTNVIDIFWKFSVQPSGGLPGCLPSTESLKYGQQLDPNGCFYLKGISGKWNCSYDCNRLKTVVWGEEDLKSPYGGTEISWLGVAKDKRYINTVADCDHSSSTTNSDRVAHTMYVNMANSILQESQKMSNSLFVLPKSLDLYEKKSSWMQKFTSFSISTVKQLEADINELGNSYRCNGNDKTVIHYETCSDDSGFSRLYRDANIDYANVVRKKGGTIVPTGGTLIWANLGYEHSIRETLPSWSLNARPSRHVFSDWVLDAAGRCGSGSVRSAVCASNPITGKKTHVNPWVAGDFNPFEKFDTRLRGTIDTDTSLVQELVDCSCDNSICENADALYYKEQFGGTCGSQNGKQPGTPNIPKKVSMYSVAGERISAVGTYDNNLCSHSPIMPRTCSHPQGMLGGMTGRSMSSISSLPPNDVLYIDVPVVHTDSGWNSDGIGMFKDGGNKWYQSEKVSQEENFQHGIIKQNKFELGGHHIVLKVKLDAKNVPYMMVDRTPLTSPHTTNEKEIWNSSLFSQDTHGNTGWLRNLEPIMRSEKSRMDILYPFHQPGQSNKKWSCPLRRIAFWSRVVDDDVFSPLVPSPPRAGRLFGGLNGGPNMNYGSRSHPTMLTKSLRMRLPVLHTSNGFCMCVGKSQNCDIDGGKNLCSLIDTVNSLKDQIWRPSMTIYGLESICDEQLDWPYEGGTMRDGSSKKSNNYKEYCDVSRRLPGFQYRYMPNGVVKRPSDESTSLGKGGSCHMGVAPETKRSFEIVDGVCNKINETIDSITVRCHNKYESNTHESILVLNKTLSKAPSWSVERMKEKRKKCSECSPMPSWVDQSGHKLPKDAEVSYGIPFRWSASRLLAADVKSMLCGHHHGIMTEECNDTIENSSWTMENFIKFFTGDTSMLFKNATQTPNSNSVLQATKYPDPISDDALWNGKDAAWVGCSQQPDGKCFGGIKKTDWYSPQRGTHCVDGFTELVKKGLINESTVELDICNLDSSLNDMCLHIKSALVKVATGNCILAGGCKPEAFVYSPGMYSQSNQDFVRGTVISFYETFGLENTRAFSKDETPNGELVCPRDDEELELRQRNYGMMDKCASTQMNVIKNLLNEIRKIVHIILNVFNIMFQLTLTLFRLLIPSVDISSVVSDAGYWFQELLLVAFDLIKQIGNLFFRLITDMGGMGDTMKEILEEVCKLISTIMVIWNTTMCILLRDAIVPAIRILVDLLGTIIGFFGGNDGVVTFLYQILDFFSNTKCDYAIACNIPDESAPSVALGALPVSSRCWANYNPLVDDISPYACSRSDTCSMSPLAVGIQPEDVPRRDVCDSCPYIPGDQVNRFGCDTYSKQCSCSVPKTATDSCMHNEECMMQGDTLPQCALVNDFTTGIGFGTLECQSCPSTPVCHISNMNSGVGRCSCLQQTLSMQKCSASNAGQRSMPDPSALCAVSTDSTSAKSINSLYMWKKLATVPCALISSGNSYCYRTDEMNYIVVGHRVLTSGRRLLSIEDQESAWDIDDEMEDFISWNTTAEPCKMLANSRIHGDHLSVTEEALLKTCVLQRQLGRLVIDMFNLTEFKENDNFLMSITDFTQAISRRGALGQILKTPGLVQFILLHHSLVKPWISLINSIAQSVAVKYMDATIWKIPELLAKVENASTQNGNLTFVEVQEFAMHLLDPISSGNTISIPIQSIVEEIEIISSTTELGEPVVQNASQPTIHGRRLFQLDEAVVKYSSLVAARNGFSNVPIGNTMADNWLEGPFSWPPVLTIGGQDDLFHCGVVDTSLQIMVQAGGVMGTYFSHMYVTDNVLSWRLVENIPKTYDGIMPMTNTSEQVGIAPKNASGSGNWAEIFAIFLMENIMGQVFGITVDSIQLFFTTTPAIPRDVLTARNLAKDMLMCDFESVMLCNRHRRHIAMSLVLSLIFYVVMSTIFTSIGLDGLKFVLWFIIPTMTLWLSYGLSPMCLPMLPTCIVDDLMSSLQISIPTRIVWPDALQIYPSCVGPKWYDPNAIVIIPNEFLNVTRGSPECMLSCKSNPFNFTSWESTVAWALCTLNASTCSSLDVPYFPSVKQLTLHYSTVIQRGYNSSDSAAVDENAAYTFCFWATMAQAIPYLILALALVLLVIVLAKLPFQIASSGVQCIVQALAYTHLE